MLTPVQIIAARIAVTERIRAAGFADLLEDGLDIDLWDNARQVTECPPGHQTWQGRYIPWWSPTTVQLAVERHEDAFDAADTIIHELGHRLWELLAEDAKESWCLSAKHPLGPEEAFADDFNFLTFQPELMRHRELFKAITTIQELPPLE